MRLTLSISLSILLPSPAASGRFHGGEAEIGRGREERLHLAGRRAGGGHGAADVDGPLFRHSPDDESDKLDVGMHMLYCGEDL